MQAVKHTQNELALELHKLDWLTYLSAFWDQTMMLNECANLLTACHEDIIFRGVMFDKNGSILFDRGSHN